MSPRRVARKLKWVARHHAQAMQRQTIYARYRDATMLHRQAYLDNLAIAERIAGEADLSHGAVVECGTWRGGMAAGLMEVLGNGRAYHFFDSFNGLPPAQQVDGEAALQWQANKAASSYFDNCTASEAEFVSTLSRVAETSKKCTIHPGLFEETVARSDTGPVAVLRIDGDWYRSTLCCLEALFPRLLPGGIVIIDDYGTWDGCTRALHDYLAAQERPEPIERFGTSAVPYLRKRKI